MPFAEDLPGNSFVIWHGPVKKFFTEYLPEHPYEFGEPEEPAGGASSQASKSKGKKKAGGAAEKKTNGSATDKDKPKATRKKKTAEGAVASPPKGSPKKKAAAAVAATRSADISPISEDSSVEKTSSATPPQDTPVESTLPLSPPDDHSSAGPTPVQPVKKPPRKKSESKPEDQAEKAKPQRKKSTGGSDGDKVEKKKRAPKEVTATSPTSPAEISSELPVSLGATTDESSTPAPVVVAKPKKKRAAETLEKPESSKKARHSLPNIALGLAGASKRPVSSSENDPNAAAPPPKAKKPRKSMPAKIEGVVDAEAKKPRASKSSVPPPIDMDKVIDMGVERMSNFIREIGYTPGKAIPEGLHHSILRFSDEIFRADVSRLDDAFYTRLSTLLGQEQRKLKVLQRLLFAHCAQRCFVLMQSI
ncbi:hypothetical protein BC832DRAFT_198552 [Gaertneriomyces semiglobifer]|nr:hypothetical protein BC832DRAFT_198552 [Gaertneriomyces semiglobifer]